VDNGKIYMLLFCIGDFNAKNIAQDLNRLLEGDMNIEALRKFLVKLNNMKIFFDPIFIS
jgi:hypothetical protein